ncbi:phosphoenolpyruvate--protein phosphotransferase [Tanticharoenia sakaeratensis]|uniref:Phosphoenolpyruvate-protein phosphotransferase n=1 Tax=Tanticharoenia sakaeratensis NBRC 103193 TaxID=1231623 RepID=A0A0D6MLW7_9PROT|nr:phosphoenolpyruvate--protein phosphotransferase [Tanticharoenia sakaeratensis]GAN54677.1 phosphoenolpyruvate-protein phosphotransferase [Tanticharoenia sakaeratensis NBRC 103193]GBQ16786.1 phosphoenolpyruvate-protein phosphotransferase [Tanticharoenia sakaeratensis NBRC 103193]
MTDTLARERTLTGEAVVPGIATGPAAVVRESPVPAIDRTATPADPATELARLDAAIARALHQIEKLQRKLATLPEEGQVEIGSLLAVYQRMLGPSRLTRAIRARIETACITADAAVHDETEALATLAHAARGPTPDAPSPEDEEAARRRAGEIREIGRRLLRNLAGVAFRAFSTLPEGCILVAEQLRPADVALIDPTRIRAVVARNGGGADHTAIMLRALDIPAVLGVPHLLDAVRDGDALVLDAGEDGIGRITTAPAPTTLTRAHDQATAFAHARRSDTKLRRLPARLVSGEDIELLANVELPTELPQLKRAGAAGIGLLRTEFLFAETEGDFPDELAQAALYKRFIKAMGGASTTIRVLDWGGEKGHDQMARLGLGQASHSDNPALGLRGLRLLLRHPHLLETQLAAILRAGATGPVRVLLPMVTSSDEIMRGRDIYERTARKLRRRGVTIADPLPPLGVMIETPAAALTADIMARRADFLALGTNDLTMYTLAVDRALADVASLYAPLHPAVLRLIASAASAALQIHRPVSVCGEIAADPRAVALLIGLGLRSFSMSASALPRVKRMVRSLTLDACDRLARQALAETDPARVRALVRDFKPTAA